MSLCSQYIDKLDNYRKMVNKKMKNKELEELFQLSKSTELKEKELEELYQNFDSVFLHLFPIFDESSMPNLMSAKMRISVVSRFSSLGLTCISGCNRALKSSTKFGNKWRNTESKFW